MSDLSTDVPLTLGYRDDLPPIGTVVIDRTTPPIPRLHEYFILPSYVRGADDGWEIVSYALVHRSQVAPQELLEQREAQS